LFAKNPEDERFYAIKIFPDTFQGRLDFEKERMRHKYFSHSQYLVKAIECVSKEEAQPIPRNLLGYLHSRFQNEDFNYIIMPKLGNNTLLDFLMRTIHHKS
jgi:serine/threonine protein kinase